jgi:hypothetical protein
MSSLVTYASPWNDDGSGNKKRQSTMRKPSKLRPTIQNIEQPEEYMTFSENFQSLQPTTIDDAQANATDRADRVNELLNKITSADTGNDSKMGDFAPLEPPSLNVKKDLPDNSLSNQYIPPVPTFPHFNQQPTQQNSNAKYSANSNGLDKYSSYGKSYDGTPYYAKMGLGQGNGTNGSNDKLMEKINYMIHLLEQQQNEKTDNITEEFILYTFLGVFMIFIVDSFARTGKYIR